MTTAAAREQSLEKHIQKHMGCMAGFLHIFDRHHFLFGKRFYSAKRLPPSPVAADTTPEKSSSPSPAILTETESEGNRSARRISSSPSPAISTETESDGNRSARRSAPRLSLDSRATTDAKGSLHPKEIRPDNGDSGQRHGSPSVIARLMGLDPLSPDSSRTGNQPELRRSASESRLSKDLFQSRFLPNGTVFTQTEEAVRYPDPRGEPTEGLNRGDVNSTPQRRAPPHRKSFFYFGDIFPEPKQTPAIHGEIEKRTGTKGVNQPSQDLEALKQILESMQLKGLLRSKSQLQQNQTPRRNYVHDEPPIAPTKPSRPRASTPISPANGRNQARVGRRSFAETPPSVSPRRDRTSPSQSPTRTGRSPSPTTRSGSLPKPKSLSVETQRKTNSSPANPKPSPKLSPTKTGTDPTVRSKKLPTEVRRKEKASKVAVSEDDSSSSISGTSTNTDGRNVSPTDHQPSPVSVLDSSFFKEESLTPSPVSTKHNIDFKDQSSELEEDSSIQFKLVETSDNSDFSYISDILEAVRCLPKGSDVFLFLENQQYASKVGRLGRKLVFDTVDEILDRNKRWLPWKAISLSPGKILSEVERIREGYSGEDLFESVCSVLRKDMAGESVSGWGDHPVEMSEVALDVERLIFKDLICDSLEDLMALASQVVPKRKLVF